jgi:hypothetical protein
MMNGRERWWEDVTPTEQIGGASGPTRCESCAPLSAVRPTDTGSWGPMAA